VCVCVCVCVCAEGRRGSFWCLTVIMYKATSPTAQMLEETKTQTRSATPSTHTGAASQPHAKSTHNTGAARWLGTEQRHGTLSGPERRFAMQWDAEVEDGGGPAQSPAPAAAVARAAAERADFGRRPLQPPQPATAIGGYLAHMHSQVCRLASQRKPSPRDTLGFCVGVDEVQVPSVSTVPVLW
jgi:hypothetical protein